MAIRSAAPAPANVGAGGRAISGSATETLLFKLENSVEDVPGFRPGDYIFADHFRFDSFGCYVEAHFTVDLAIRGDNANVVRVDPGDAASERYLQSFHGHERPSRMCPRDGVAYALTSQPASIWRPAAAAAMVAQPVQRYMVSPGTGWTSVTALTGN